MGSPPHTCPNECRVGGTDLICIANLANHRSPRLFSDALPVTRCLA